MTNFTDEILSTEWKEAELENNDLENYKGTSRILCPTASG